MKPGDVLIHDIMVLHGSTQNLSQTLRRVIYYEFRAASHIRSAGWWDDAWINKRLDFLQCALHERKLHPYGMDDEAFDYHRPERFQPHWRPGRPVELKVKH